MRDVNASFFLLGAFESVNQVSALTAPYSDAIDPFNVLDRSRFIGCQLNCNANLCTGAPDQHNTGAFRYISEFSSFLLG